MLNRRRLESYELENRSRGYFKVLNVQVKFWMKTIVRYLTGDTEENHKIFELG